MIIKLNKGYILEEMSYPQDPEKRKLNYLVIKKLRESRDKLRKDAKSGDFFNSSANEKDNLARVIAQTGDVHQPVSKELKKLHDRGEYERMIHEKPRAIKLK